MNTYIFLLCFQKDYYVWASSARYMNNIDIPMVFLNSLDDPVVPPELQDIPLDYVLKSPNAMSVVTQVGLICRCMQRWLTDRSNISLSVSVCLSIYLGKFIYRSARITRCAGTKTSGPPPPLQPKRLGQISSFFGERPLMGIY